MGKKGLISLLVIPFIFLIHSTGFAADGAELFQKLTCFTCHGEQGKGMFRTETKGRYRFKKKERVKLKKLGVPAGIIKQLKP
ncbi:MAG: hypothetical protein HQ517_03055, partial [SAR324 cluster bacterium]|nr:hypothetical protein [SAR324 cluster bacterium]